MPLASAAGVSPPTCHRFAAAPGLLAPQRSRRSGWLATVCCFVLLCNAVSARAALPWDYLVERVMAQAPPARAELINFAINQLDHADPVGPTVWQTPQELLLRGAGDCKDFALAKYWLLRQAGTPAERVRLAYADWQDGSERRLHLVVLLWVDADSPLVLDNLLEGMHRLSARRDLHIRFSFDEAGFYDRIGGQQIGEQPIKGWRGLWQRMAPERRLLASGRSMRPGRPVPGQ